MRVKDLHSIVRGEESRGLRTNTDRNEAREPIREVRPYTCVDGSLMCRDAGRVAPYLIGQSVSIKLMLSQEALCE